MNLQEQVIWSILEERGRQDRKWGSQRTHSPEKWLTILMEEVGEVARASLEDDPLSYIEELVQVAAVAVAALESHYAQQKIIEDACPDLFNPVEGGESALRDLEIIGGN